MSIDLSLDRIQEIYNHLPPYTRPTIHVAGTNGKGSVCALLSSILHASAFTVGRFTSPHLISVYDSININGNPISADEYDSARDFVLSKRLEVSSFELLTLTALVVFERAKVDFVVLEVGMGGRLDATNVIPDSSVVVSVLTAVDLDHQAFLGDTVEAITREKASISRKNRPFVLGRQMHAEAVESVCRHVVDERGGELVVVGPSTVEELPNSDLGVLSPNDSTLHVPPPQPVLLRLPCFSEPIKASLPLHGQHQLDNLAIAVTVITVLLSHPSCAHLGLSSRLQPSAIAHGIASTTWPGRLSFHRLHNPPLLILADGAHNPASAETLARYIHRLDPERITYILALSHSPPKTPEQTLSPLLLPRSKLRVAVLRFTPPEGMPWVKSVDPTVIRDVVEKLRPGTDVYATEALDAALNWAADVGGDKESHLVVVAGSLYLVADLYRRLKVNQ
ncbi:folylpolyglutamate synthase [Marasmius crinis-equi]|uniref:Folylpolyglutamate synthase n=1 Tax=Marasmius crinis-equi TaxID=585013 RepID=A0ABR3EPP4_9AGAR